MNRGHSYLRRTLLALGLCVMGAVGAASASDIPAPVQIPAFLTLAQALQLFHAHGLDLLLADANVESARADVKLAGAVQNPTVNGGINKSFDYNPNDPTACPPGAGCSDVGWSVGLSDSALWDVVTGKRGLRIKTADAALKAARLGRKDAERTLLFQVKQQFVQVALAQRALEFAREVEQAAGQTADLNKRRYTAGAISEVDLSKVETDWLEAQQALDSAVAGLRLQQVGLAFLLGARGPVPEFHAQFDLAQRQDVTVEGSTGKTQLIEQAMGHRPDLQAQAAQEERAQAGLEAAYRQRVPDGSLSIAYAQQGTGQYAIQPPTLTFGIQLTLPVFNQNQGGVQKSRADVFQQDVGYAKLKSQVVSDVETSYTQLYLNRSLITRLETGLLDRAKRTRDLQRLRYQKGAASLLDYLDAQRVYIASTQEYILALANYWTARFQLEQAVGL
jgi:cobalt-zinc-cadmium efflux system outer membrane protein